MDLQELKKLSKEDAFKWASQHSGVPVDILDGLWATESGRGTNTGPSSAGARGDFQITPHTQKLFERRFGHPINPDDFHESLYLAAEHLKDDLRREKGDVGNALRAYNNGPDWRTQKDPRGENAAYAGKIFAAAKRDPSAVQVEADRKFVESVAPSIARVAPVDPLLPFVEGDAASMRADEIRRENTGVLDVLQEKWGDGRENAAQWMADLIGSEGRDHTFDYYNWAGRSELEAKAQTPQELIFMRENMTSADNAWWVNQQLEEYRRKDAVYSDASVGDNLAASLGVGVFDPVGWGIGFGAGKIASIGRAGLRAYSLSANATRAGLGARVAGTAVAEGVAGNVGWELFQDVSGQNKTIEDYGLAVAFGAGFTAPFVPTAIRRAIDEASPTATAHVEAFRLAEQQRLVNMDVASTKANVAQQLDDINATLDATRVGGNERRPSAKVIPDELVARSVDDDADLNAVDPVIMRATVETPEPVAPIAPVAAPTAPQAPADGASVPTQPDGTIEAPAAPDAAVVEKLDQIIGRLSVVEARREELRANGRIPRKGSTKRAEYDRLGTDAEVLREASLRLELQAEQARGELRAPKTEQLDPVKDGSDNIVQPAAQEPLGQALEAARSSKGVDADMREAINTLLRFLPLDTLKKTLVNFVPGGKVRGVWRTDRGLLGGPEIVIPGDARGGKGMEGGRARVLVHEAFHAAAADVINRWKAGLPVSENQRLAIERLQEVWKEFQVEANARGFKSFGPTSEKGAGYASSDFQEFVAQAMMDAETQRILTEMKGRKYETASLWDSFWDAIVSALGLKADKGTALYDVVRQMEVLVRTQGNIPEGVTMRPPVDLPPLELKAGQESVPVRSSRDSNFFTQLYEHAASFVSLNPIDPNKLDTLANKYTSGAVRDSAVSDGLKMASSKNKIVQMLSSLLVETTTGASGRRTTAALLHHMYHHRIIGSAVNEYDQAATNWVQRNGGGWVERLTKGQVDQQFDRLVYEEALRRRYAIVGTPVDGAVKAAADAMERLFQRSLDQQKRSGTLGSAWLPESSVGYLPQSLKGDAMRQMDVTERAQLKQFLADHWASVYKWDSRFSLEFAHHYLVRAQREAAGERHVDHVATNGATSAVKDTLAEMKLEMRSLDARTAGELEKVGAAPYAKHRLDIPLMQTLPNGKRLLDYFDTDVKKLARSHARSVAGQAALAENNILGQRGVNNLLRAIREAPVGQEAEMEEIHAVERTFSTFLGTPWAGEHRNRLASGLAGFTRLRLMGGLAWTQLGEMANGMHTVGLSATLESIGSLPRMISEVKAAVNGETLANKWLGSVDRFAGMELGTEQYRMASAFDAPDDLLREYGKGSNVVERAIQSGNHAQSKISFHRGLQAAQHRAFAEQIVMRSVDYLLDKSPVNDRYLDDMGFNAAMRKALRDVLPNAVERDAAGNNIGLDIYKFENTELMEDYVAAVQRGTAQIIQNSFIGEQGAWAHSDLQKLAFQLRTFGLTAMEKQWARNRMLAGPGLDAYAYAAGVLMAQMAFVTPIYLARLQANAMFRDDREEYIAQGLAPAAMVQAMMNYSTAGGLAGDAFDAVITVGSGWNDDIKETMGSRGMDRGVGGLVPGLGTVDQGIRTVKSAADIVTGEQSPANALKMLPGSNLPYVQAVINVTR